MSMPTFKIALAIGSLVALTGCQFNPVKSFAASLPEGAVPITRSLPGGVVIRGPEGYCLDNQTKHIGLRDGAVTLASCARLATDKVVPDFTDGRLLTATSLRSGPANLQAVGAFLKTHDGRRLLSSSGAANTVTVHRVRVTRAGVYVDYTDTARAVKLGARAWRGILNVHGKYVLLGVYAGKGESVAGDAGEQLIREFAEKILQQNLAKP